MVLFGRVKGVPEPKLSGFVDKMLSDLGLTPHEFKVTRTAVCTVQPMGAPSGTASAERALTSPLSRASTVASAFG